MNIVIFVTGIIIGTIGAYIIFRTKMRNLQTKTSQMNSKIQETAIELQYLRDDISNKMTELNQSKKNIQELNNSLANLKEEKGKAEMQAQLLTENIDNLKNEKTKMQTIIEDLQTFNTKLKVENSGYQKKIEEHTENIKKLQASFTTTFENLANNIFEEKSRKFVNLNNEKIDNILSPLKREINEFKQKVENNTEKNVLNSVNLMNEIRNLEKLNSQISNEANNLTKALKGNVKIQGNWGEVILERILETSGLTEGREYISQARGMNLKNEEYRLRKPDVVILLPENKHLIIDAKVSLVAYQKYIETDDKEKMNLQIKMVLKSVKQHIDELHEKHYHNLDGLNSPDYVLMFMPVEGSFNLVGKYDDSLFQYGLDKSVFLVSPSTLLVTLRTVAYIWRQENQTKNALEIANSSGNLYDAFIRLLEELDKVGINIRRAQNSYDEAIKRISTGKGNLISRIEKIKKLGAKTNKKLPEKYVNKSNPELNNN